MNYTKRNKFALKKTVLITDGSSGCGAACARDVVDSGHQVAIAAGSLDKLEQLTDELGSENAVAIESDVTKPEQQERTEKWVAKNGVEPIFATSNRIQPVRPVIL